MRTQSEENYLKVIFKLNSMADTKAALKTISGILQNNPASVIDMLKKLKDKGLLTYDKTKGAWLTPEGKQTALQIIRKHRLWEVFLKEKLDYNWSEVHDIAEQLEHVKHPDLADRLDKFLGFPEYDPHGDPIPKSNGELEVILKRSLSELTMGEVCKVIAVNDTSLSFLTYLQTLKIGIGTKIKILGLVPFDESYIIQTDTGEHTVSKKFADSLWVN